MKVLQTLARKQVRYLVQGELFSATGDEIYKATLMLLATEQMAERAGILSAIESGTVLAFALFLPSLAARFRALPTLRVSQWAKFISVGGLLAVAQFTKVSPLPLAVLALSLAVISVFFEPGLQRVIPLISAEVSDRQDTNVAIEMTRRLAAILGPGIIAVIGTGLAQQNFFFFAGIAFFLAGTSFSRLKAPTASAQSSGDSSAAAFWFPKRRILQLSLLASVSVWGFWALVFQLGLPLAVRQRFPGSVATLYGTCLSTYGIANVLANAALGWVKLPNSLRPMWLGIAIMGAGFTVVAFSPSIPILLGGVCLAACGGPLSDLAFLNLMQVLLDGAELEQFYRLRMGYANGIMLILFALSPTLFTLTSVTTVIAACSVALIVISMSGGVCERLYCREA